MANKKFMFFNAGASAGFYEDQDTTDDFLTLPDLDMGGNIDLGSSGGQVTNLATTGSSKPIGFNQSGVSLGAVTVSSASNHVVMNGNNITGSQQMSSSGDAATKADLDAVTTNAHWKEGVTAMELINDTLNEPPGGDSAGDTYVVGSSPTGSWSTKNTGDTVEFDGDSTWTTLVAASGGYVPSGTRLTVTTGTAGGGLTGEEGEIATANGSGGWTFYDPQDGDCVLVLDSDSYWAWSGFAWDETGTAWHQFTAAADLTAGDGLLRTGNTLDVRFGDGTVASSEKIALDLGTDKGLEFNAGELQIDLATDSGLEFSTGLRAKTSGSHGVHLVTNEISLEVDSTLTLGANGVKVAGVPDAFKIKGVATTTSEVTHTKLNALTDGSSNCDAYHTHTSSASVDQIEIDWTNNTGVQIDAGKCVQADTTNNQIVLADPVTNLWPMGVVRTNIAHTASGPVVSEGVCAGVLSSATAGTRYFLEASGALATSAPADSGDRVVQMGIAINATDLFVRIAFFGTNT